MGVALLFRVSECDDERLRKIKYFEEENERTAQSSNAGKSSNERGNDIHYSLVEEMVEKSFLFNYW